MSGHVLLNLINKLSKRDKMQGVFAMSLLNPIILEHECWILLII